MSELPTVPNQKKKNMSAIATIQNQCIKLIMLVKRERQVGREERIRLIYRAEVRRRSQRWRLSG